MLLMYIQKLFFRAEYGLTMQYEKYLNVFFDFADLLISLLFLTLIIWILTKCILELLHVIDGFCCY